MKTLVTLASFAALCAAASFVPNPRGEGNLIDIWPELPPAFASAQQEREGADVLAADDVTVAAFDFSGFPTEDMAIDTVVGDTHENSLAAAARERPESESADGDQAGYEPTEPVDDELASTAHVDSSGAVAAADPRDAELARRIQAVVDASSIAHPVTRPCLQTRSDGVCAQRSLDRFFEALRRTAYGEAAQPARWSQFGDSLVVGDDFNAELRRLFGEQFGYGGHGFVYLGTPERRVGNDGLRVTQSDAWDVLTIVRGGRADTLYGYGGAVFVPREGPTFEIRPSGDEHRFTRLGLLHFATRAPLSFRLHMGDGSAEIVEMSTTRGESGLHWLDVPAEADRVRLSGFAPMGRYYGVIAENPAGVVIDNLGLVSSQAERLTRIDEAHWSSQVALRDADVISLFYGVNSAWDGLSNSSAGEYREEYAEVLSLVRRVAPDRDCFSVGILSRGDIEGGRPRIYESVAQIATIQQEEATTHGCASWSAFEAIGGNDGITQWYDLDRIGSDLSHATRSGYRTLASSLYISLMAEFVVYLDERGQR
jgi:hypothetical protein